MQRAIARDIERVKGASLTDIPALANRLDELAKALDELPVANAVGALGRPVAAAPLAVAEPAPEPLPDAQVTEPGVWARTRVAADALWARVWSEVRDEARDLLRVSRIDQPEALLLAPEQAFMLRQNLKMQLLNARLALLARQIPQAQADVLTAAAAVRRYFDEDAATTRHMLKALAQVQSEMKSTDLPRPTETLAALAAAASGR